MTIGGGLTLRRNYFVERIILTGVAQETVRRRDDRLSWTVPDTGIPSAVHIFLRELPASRTFLAEHAGGGE
jgi:hypothetical protein